MLLSRLGHSTLIWLVNRFLYYSYEPLFLFSNYGCIANFFKTLCLNRGDSLEPILVFSLTNIFCPDT